MKKWAFALVMMLSAGMAMAAESAGITGMVLTNDTVEVNNFSFPKNIHTVYYANEPGESSILLVYLSYKKIGTHTPYVEIKDKTGKVIDRCTTEPATATKMPWVHTMTCRWGGRLPDGGLTLNVFNKYGGKQEKLGELYVAPKDQ